MMDRKTIQKLQKAINLKFNQKIVISANQWYSTEQDRPITTHIIKKMVVNENGKKIYIELFKSTSLLQIGLFLRDMWYELNGWEVLTEGFQVKKESE